MCSFVPSKYKYQNIEQYVLERDRLRQLYVLLR